MATYYGTYGQKVQYLSSDPSDPQTGQVWYNSTSAVLKVRSVTTSGTWATSPNLNAATGTGGAAGIQTAALTFGLPGPPGDAPTLISQSWNGSTWTTTPSLPRGGDYTSGFGTQTAAVSAGDGRPVSANYSNLWGGSTWTTGNNTTQYGYAAVGLGIQTAGMLAGRYDGEGPGITNYVELFNGTSWSNNPADLNTSRYNPQGSGTQTAALVFGGTTDPGATGVTESYNGTSWTTLNSLNTGRGNGAGSGTQTAALCYGGANPGSTGATELWNGTSWTNNPNSMNTARAGLNNTLGVQTATLALGSGPANISVESWTGPGVAVTQTVTVS
jgi:hypothetical protein